MFETQFVAYDGNTRGGVLDAPQSWSWDWTRNDSPALKISFLKTSPSAQVLLESLKSVSTALDIAIEFRWRGMDDGSSSTWTEPPNGRFVIMEDEQDPSEVGGLLSLTGVGVDQDLAGLYDAAIRTGRTYGRAEIKANYARLFTGFNFTPGTIMGDVLADAQAKSAGQAGQHDNFLPLLSYNFSSGFDSNQVAWAKTLRKFAWPADSSIRAILSSFAEQGVADWWFEGNKLCLFNRGGGYTNRSLIGVGAGETALLLGAHVAAAPQTRSRRLVTRDFIVMGENGVPWRSFQIGTATKRGSRFTTVQGGGVDSSTDAQALGATMIGRYKRPSFNQLVRTLTIDDSTQTLPIKSYAVGDTILAPGPDGALEPLQIEALTLTGDASGRIGGQITLTDVFAANPTAKRVASMNGGSSIPTSAGVATPIVGGDLAIIDTVVSNLVTNQNSSADVGEELALRGKSGKLGTAAELVLTGDSTGGRVYSGAIFARTYGSGANVYVTSAGTLGRFVSASKYKVNIREQDYGDAILDLPVKSWYDKATCEAWASRLEAAGGDEAEAAATTDDIPSIRRVAGLIAEDVEAAGLGDFVAYSDETGDIEGLQYAQLLTTLIPIARTQRDQIAEQRSQIAALAARVAALEGSPT